MVEWNTILNLLTLGLVGAGGYALYLVKEATSSAVKTAAEEAAKATIEQLQWPMELARELQKARGVERQELRYQSYGTLWGKLRPLAIYDETAVNKATIRALSSELSNWYFSASGGLLLTPQARDFYFALQDLLRITAEFPEDWSVDRAGVVEDDPVVVLRDVLKQTGQLQASGVLDYFSERAFDDWQNQAPQLASNWRTGIRQIAAAWSDLNNEQRFAVLQQTGSMLRTSLATDLDSRLR
ncbi:hypothetical protein QTH97_16555 [Variovorax sp. J22R24]|uniref:hypothetical protein n=1 Tax=Variovorax gracilis TaxID=3053502 RepID=UPI002574D290|nr:hypothetical protein [Variovorax sp. J22R24]MDM0106559.1 hypothetical protein [Variovorax sp. J22R24]